MSTIISRVGYCPECAKNGSPKTNQPFLVFGSSSNALKAMRALHNGRKGFVPTFYKLRKVQDNKIFYQTCCGVCGIYPYSEDDKNWLAIDEEQWSGWKKTTLDNWNNLVLRWKDMGFEI